MLHFFEIYISILFCEKVKSISYNNFCKKSIAQQSVDLLSKNKLLISLQNTLLLLSFQ